MAERSPLLATKLVIPRVRPNLVLRPRLNARLTAGLRAACSLTLISAPPGFGKTTIVAQWTAAIHLPAAWLSLDSDDNDPQRFLGYLTAALRSLSGHLVEASARLLESPQPSPSRAVVTAIINSLGELSGPCLLVLDDYHFITEAGVHEALACLVEHLPPSLHVLLLTRADPPLPLARMRARGQLAELRAADLRFTADEAAVFLTEVMGLPLSRAGVDALERRTEGWIAGLQLAAVSMQGRDDLDAFVASFSGSHHFIIDYLTEEVLSQQPAEVRAFLLQTSILDRLAGPLCDAMTADSGPPTAESRAPTAVVRRPSSFVLEELARANLFLIPLDDEHRWFRYHHLFADLLRSRLQRECPMLVPELHRCASRWLAQNGDLEAAMKHALAAPDLALATDLAEAHLPVLIRSSRIATGLQWIRTLPEATLCVRAHLCASCAWVYCLHGQPGVAEPYIDAGEAALAHYTPVFSQAEHRLIEMDEVRGTLTAARAHCARQQAHFLQAIALSAQALQELPPAAHALRGLVALNLGILHLETGNLELSRGALREALDVAQRASGGGYTVVTALSMLGAVAFYQGQLSAAAAFCQDAIRLGSDQAGGAAAVQAIGYAHGWLVAVHDQRHELAEAERHWEIASELVEEIGPQESIVYSHLYRARLALGNGDLHQAEVSLQRAERLMETKAVGGNVTLEWVVNRARLYLQQGQIAAAGDWLKTQGIGEAELLEPARSAEAGQALQLRLPAYMVLAHVHTAQGRLDQAYKLLDAIRTLAEAARYAEVFIEAVALLAIVADRRRERAQALQHVRQALTLAAPQGWKRPLFNVGKPLVPLLLQISGDCEQEPFVLSVLGDLAETSGFGPASPAARAGTGAAAGLVEPLTERELEVLRLIADGLSNAEIGSRLVVTVGTVKAHTSNLYSKLNVNTRTQAVAQARTLGLL